jgi:hypothetical protein
VLKAVGAQNNGSFFKFELLVGELHSIQLAKKFASFEVVV